MDIVLVVNSVRSLYNVGSLFRLADGLGIGKIILGGYSGIVRYGNVIELNPKLKKTALEGINIGWEHSDNLIDTVNDLKRNNYEIIALELTPQSIDYRDVRYHPKTAVIVGHERDGIDQELLDLSDQIVELPMKGKGKSLNVAIATGILISEIDRQIG